MENKNEENRLLKNIKLLLNPEESKKYFPLKEQLHLEIKTQWFQQEGKHISLLIYFFYICALIRVIVNFPNIYGRSEEFTYSDISLYGFVDLLFRLAQHVLFYSCAINLAIHLFFLITILNNLIFFVVLHVNTYFRVSATNFEKLYLSYLKINIYD